MREHFLDDNEIVTKVKSMFASQSAEFHEDDI